MSSQAESSTQLQGENEVESSHHQTKKAKAGLSKNLSKWLFFCWAIVVAHIWFASDGSEDFLDPQHRHDPHGNAEYNLRLEGFGEPEREIRLVVDPPFANVTENHFFQLVANQSSLEDEIHQYIPDALEPISSKSCCIIPMFVKSRDPNDKICFGTCFTERACRDFAYPFASVEEKSLFPMANYSKKDVLPLRTQCTAPKMMTPPVKWCQKEFDVETNQQNSTKNDGFAHLVPDIPPAGCSIAKNAGGSGAFQHLLLFPSVKLAFCGIPKVGITQWIQFLRFVAGAKDYLSLPHYKLDVNPLRFDKLQPSVQRQIWEDPNWTFAVFLRDPAERLLSAYLDKVAKYSKKKDMEDITFDEFIELLSQPYNETSCKGSNGMLGLNWCSDPHWRPQIYSCGLSEKLDRFQFVGDIDKASEQTRQLLLSVGNGSQSLWDSHGKYFVQKGVMNRNMCNIIPDLSIGNSSVTNEQPYVGFQQKNEAHNTSAENTEWKHSKGSRNKMDEYYTPELLQIVRNDLYEDDYNIWKLLSGKDKMVNGKQLASELSQSCKMPP